MLNLIPSGTTAHVGISLYGANKSGSRHLQRVGAFQRGSLDQFHLETDVSLGEVWKIRIWHDNTGTWGERKGPTWFLPECWPGADGIKRASILNKITVSFLFSFKSCLHFLFIIYFIYLFLHLFCINLQ